MNIPDCPPALRPLLRRLYAEAETEISQHEHTPAPDEWYAGRVLAGPGGGMLGGGDYGPYATPEEAIVRLVRHLWTRYDEVCDERDRAEAEAAEMRTAARLAAQTADRLQAQIAEASARAMKTEAAIATAARQRYGGRPQLARAAREGDPLARALLDAGIDWQGRD